MPAGAIFHLDVSSVHAGKAAAASDYRARAGRYADAANEHAAGGLVGWTSDRASLWVAAEQAEQPKRARGTGQRQRVVGRSIILALPDALDDESRARLTRGFALWLRDNHGVAVQWDIHRPDIDGDHRNHHAHLLLTSRAVDAAGTFGGKTRELDKKASASAALKAWRSEWEKRTNSALAKAGATVRVDGRTKAAAAAERAEPPPPARPRIPVGTWRKARARASAAGLRPGAAKLRASEPGGDQAQAYNAELVAYHDAMTALKDERAAKAALEKAKTERTSAAAALRAAMARLTEWLQDRAQAAPPAPRPLKSEQQPIHPRRPQQNER